MPPSIHNRLVSGMRARLTAHAACADLRDSKRWCMVWQPFACSSGELRHLVFVFAGGGVIAAPRDCGHAAMQMGPQLRIIERAGAQRAARELVGACLRYNSAKHVLACLRRVVVLPCYRTEYTVTLESAPAIPLCNRCPRPGNRSCQRSKT